MSQSDSPNLQTLPLDQNDERAAKMATDYIRDYLYRGLGLPEEAASSLTVKFTKAVQRQPDGGRGEPFYSVELKSANDAMQDILMKVALAFNVVSRNEPGMGVNMTMPGPGFVVTHDYRGDTVREKVRQIQDIMRITMGY